MSRVATVQQSPNATQAQAPVPQVARRKSKAPIVIAIVAIAIVAIVVGAGFATNWFGLGGQAPYAGSQSSSSVSSDDPSGGTGDGSNNASRASASSEAVSIQSSVAATGLPDSAAATKKLVLGFDAEYPPFGYRDDKGKYVGIDIDLAREVCERNGWSFNAVPVEWDEKDALLKSGTINCIWNGFTVEGREGKYTFSEPYMTYEYNYEDEGIRTETIAVGFKLGDTETARIVSDTLRDMYKDGTVGKILAQYQPMSDLTTDNWILK